MSIKELLSMKPVWAIMLAQYECRQHRLTILAAHLYSTSMYHFPILQASLCFLTFADVYSSEC